MSNFFIGGIAATAIAGSTWAQAVPTKTASDINQNPSFDTKGSSAHMRIQAPAMTEPVATYSKTEIDAKLALSEEKAGRANDSLGTKMDKVAEAMTALATSISGQIADLKTSVSEVKDDNKNTRWAIAGIVLASAFAVVGIVIATQGTLTTANGNVLAAFGAGKDSAETVPAVSRPAPRYDDQTGKLIPQ